MRWAGVAARGHFTATFDARTAEQEDLARRPRL
jgi:hypothetical protein